MGKIKKILLVIITTDNQSRNNNVASHHTDLVSQNNEKIAQSNYYIHGIFIILEGFFSIEIISLF